MIQYFEHKKLEVYSNPFEQLAIGYGHVGPEVIEGLKISDEECDDFY